MSKSTRSRTTARRSARTGSLELFIHPTRSTPARIVGLVWRWRVELIVMTVLVLGAMWSAEFLPVWAGALIELAVLAVVFAIPVSRRYVMRRVWCVISRHRVRTCFVQSRVMTHEGLLPLFLWTRPTAVGERVRLWLRPGLSARDVDAVTERIAVACWAREARVEVNPHRVSTVWVHVIRRDPLATAGQIRSPLLDGVPGVDSDQDTERAPLPDRMTVLGIVPGQGLGEAHPEARPVINPVSATRAAARTRISTSSTPLVGEVLAGGVVSRSGEDVSDYV